MAGEEISVASISSAKLEQASQKAEVTVFKKALEQQGEIAQVLIEGATSAVEPPPGTGGKLNIVA